MTYSIINKKTQNSQNRGLFLLLAMILLSIYVAVFPPGYLGVLICLFAFLLVLVTSNISNLAFFFLFVTPMIFGTIFRSFSIPYLGSVFCVILGFIFMIHTRGLPKPVLEARWREPAFWLLLTLAILSLAYFLGPQSEKSLIKLYSIFIQFTLSLFAFELFFNDKRINTLTLGLIYIFSGVLAYAVILFTYPDIRPPSIFETGTIRLLSKAASEYTTTDNVALSICFGVALVISSLERTHSQPIVIFISLWTVTLSFIVLNSLGHRSLILIPVLVAIAILITSKKLKGHLVILATFLSLMVAITILYGFAVENEFITSIFNSDGLGGLNLNREANWDSAISLMYQAPLFGHGLGGYFIEGFSSSGEGNYAHNIVLEILTETGIIGFSIIIGAPFLILFRHRSSLGKFSTNGGVPVIGVFIMLLTYFMLSRDLTYSVSLLAFLGCFWAYMPNWLRDASFKSLK